MNSLRIIRMWCFGIALAAGTHSSLAMLRILFSPGPASWDATHIVVVKTTTTDGIFEVVESWKGDLPAGSHVLIPELIPPANGIPISAYPKSSPNDRSGVSEQIPRQPVGSQLVLFLKRKGAPATKGQTRNADWSGWSISNGPDSMKIAAVWIDGDRTYSFQQQGSTLSPLALSVRGKISKEGQHFVAESEGDLKREVAATLQLQQDEEAAIAVTNGRDRALRLEPFVNSKVFPARRLALEELGKAGPEAVSTIGEMLDDPAYSGQASELVNAMVRAGGPAVGAELNRRLEKDLAFWSSTGPSLSANWWNQDATTPGATLRNRYGQTYYLVYGLRQVGYAGALNTAIKLRDLWRTLPQLASIGNNQMAEECDKLIARLQSH